MSKKGKKKEAFVFTSLQSPEAFKLALREAVHEKGAMLYEDTEAGFDLGIERGGHSGGYWYVATLTETEDGTEMRGEIVYRSYHSDGRLREETKWEKILGWIGVSLIVLIAAPAILIGLAVWGIMELIGKLRGKPMEATMSTEEKLTHFMTEVMGCGEKE
jgi:hypothetical protein